MNHRHLRKPFRYARPHRLGRLPLLSAAAIGAATIIAVWLSQSVIAAPVAGKQEGAVLGTPAAQGQAGTRATAPATATGSGPATAKGKVPATAKAKAPATAKGKAAKTGTVAPPTDAAPAAAPPAPARKELFYRFRLQTTFYYCGPAATQIAASARGLRPSQDDLARWLGTTIYGTNSAADVTRVLNAMTRTSSYHTTSIPGTAATPNQMDQLQADVVHAVSRGYAVVVNIVNTAWDLDGNAHSYAGGHYLTVVGYEDEGRWVRIADPANMAGDGTYWMTTINLANWAATRGYAS